MVEDIESDEDDTEDEDNDRTGNFPPRASQFVPDILLARAARTLRVHRRELDGFPSSSTNIPTTQRLTGLDVIQRYPNHLQGDLLLWLLKDLKGPRKNDNPDGFTLAEIARFSGLAKMEVLRWGKLARRAQRRKVAAKDTAGS